jgi:hypothetical protein
MAHRGWRMKRTGDGPSFLWDESFLVKEIVRDSETARG